jgi:hypothetical protein
MSMGKNKSHVTINDDVGELEMWVGYLSSLAMALPSCNCLRQDMREISRVAGCEDVGELEAIRWLSVRTPKTSSWR